MPRKRMMDLEPEPFMSQTLLITEPNKHEADDWFEAALLSNSPTVKPVRNSWGEDEEDPDEDVTEDDEESEDDDPDPFEDFDEDDFDDDFDDDFEEELEDEYEIEPPDDGMIENMPGGDDLDGDELEDGEAPAEFEEEQ